MTGWSRGLFSRAGKAPCRDRAARCLLIGQPAAGRTLFARRFVAYLKEQGASCPGDPHVQGAGAAAGEAFRLTLPAGGLAGGERVVELIDAGGLPAGIHPEAAVRAAAARVLRALLSADAWLHLADAAAVGAGAPVSAVDRALAAYARQRLAGRYALLATKADHPLGRAGLLKLRLELDPERSIPVSALTGAGFREVQAFLSALP